MVLQLLQAAHALENCFPLSDDSETEHHLSDFEVPCFNLESTATVVKPHQVTPERHSDSCMDDSEWEYGLNDKSEAGSDLIDTEGVTNGHNSMEKRRRAFLAKCYLTLKAEVPTVRYIKASNATILRRAADLIWELREEEASLLEEIHAQKKIQQNFLAALKNKTTVLSSKRKVTTVQTSPTKRARRNGHDDRSLLRFENEPVTLPPTSYEPMAASDTSCSASSPLSSPSASPKMLKDTPRSPYISLPCTALLQDDNLWYGDKNSKTHSHYKDYLLENTVLGLMINGSALEDTVIGLMMLGAGPLAKETFGDESVSAGRHHGYYYYQQQQQQPGIVPTVLDDPLCGML